MVIANRIQCWDPRNRNSITTTLPLKLESIVVFPPGSLIVKSGDLRGKVAWGIAKDAVVTIRRMIRDVVFCMVMI
jgi:hypothetical protein